MSVTIELPRTLDVSGIKDMAGCYELLKAEGFAYKSCYSYGHGCEEHWWEHPSGASVNLDVWPLSLRLNLLRAADVQHKVARHEFANKAQVVADRQAAEIGCMAVRHYYLTYDSDTGLHDWCWRYNHRNQFGTSLKYVYGRDLLPEEYERLKDSFTPRK